jgi:hypothetical protein
LKTWLQSYRKISLFLALIIFISGFTFSFFKLDINIKEILLFPIFIAIAIGGPINLFLNAAELKLCAKASSANITIKKALGISSIASVTNILPIPAGIAVRGAALMSAGASMKASGTVLLVNSIMQIATALSLTGFAFTFYSHLGIYLFLFGLFLLLSCLIYFFLQSFFLVGCLFFVIRCGLLAVFTFRLFFIFKALKEPVSWLVTAYYALANTSGSIFFIFPAGLGINEGVAAMMALIINQSPPAVFLAMGTNRIVGLFFFSLVAILYIITSTKHKKNI